MVKLVSEVSKTPSSLLLLAPQRSNLISRIEEFTKDHNTEVHLSDETPPRLEQYNYVVVYNLFEELAEVMSKTKKTVIAITTNRKQFERLQPSHRLKKVFLVSEHINEKQFDRLVWYIFTPQKDTSLEISIATEPPRNEKKHSQSSIPSFSFKQFILFIIGIVGTYIFIASLLLCTSLILKSQLILHESCGLSSPDLCKSIALTSSRSSKMLYVAARPILFLFSAGLQTDSLYAYGDQLDSVLEHKEAAQKTTQAFTQSVVQTTDDPQKKLDQLVQINKETIELYNTIRQFTPSIVPYAKETNRYIDDQGLQEDKIGTILKALPYLADSKLLLLIVNNNDALPGGGRITHMGTVSLKGFAFDEIRIRPMSQIVAQAAQNQKTLPDPSILFQSLYKTKTWDDRELMFSPDLSDNYNSIRSILGSDLSITNTQGALLITYSALQNILEDTGPVTISTPNEVVSNTNLVNQLRVHADDDQFMHAVIQAIIQSYAYQKTESQNLSKVLIDAFTNKQMAFYATQKEVQDRFGKIYWSGNFVPQECRIQTAECVADFVYTVETDVTNDQNDSSSLEKRKKLEYHTQLRADGSAKVQLHLLFNLGSQPSNIDQEWYEQFILPSSISVTRVTMNGVETDAFSLFTSSYTVLGLSLHSQNQKIVDVGVEYELQPPPLSKNAVYQLVVQKQIGEQGHDMELEMQLPDNISPAQFNFSPVVNQNRVFYNTQLSTDRIFLISLSPPKQ